VDGDIAKQAQPRLYGQMIETSMINDGQPFLYSGHAALGMTKTAMREAVAAGEIVRLIDRVYADARADDTRELRTAATCLAVPAHAVLCDESAAWIWGVDANRPGDRHRFEPKWVVPHGRAAPGWRASPVARRCWMTPTSWW
jgi:hypothetical protein